MTLFSGRKLATLALVPALALTIGAGAARAQHDDQHGDWQHNGHSQNDNRGDNRGNRGNDFHFQDQNRDAFRSHYNNDLRRWQGRNDRAHFNRGDRIPTTYRVQPVPSTYWRGAPPPPPGYRYGYYQGYVVAYDPTTRIIADVMDLIAH